MRSDQIHVTATIGTRPSLCLGCRAPAKTAPQGPVYVNLDAGMEEARPRDLAGYLRERGFAAVVIEDACRAIDAGGSLAAARQAFSHRHRTRSSAGVSGFGRSLR